MKNRTIIHIRIVKGKKPVYDYNKVMQNENQIVKLEYGTLSWKNYMENLHRNGFCRVTVEKVHKLHDKRDENGNSTFDSIDTKKINDEVQAIMKPIEDKAMTQAEELAQLKKDMLELQKGNVKPLGQDGLAVEKDSDTKQTDSTDDSDSVDELKSAQLQYKELYGKRHGPKWDLETIKEKIAAKLAD